MGIEYVHIEGIIDMAMDSQVGSRIDLPGGIKAIKDYDHLVLFDGEGINSGRIDSEGSKQIAPFEYGLSIPGEVIIRELGIKISVQRAAKLGVSDRESRCIYINADMIIGDLLVRNRRDGDRFRPLGMNGTKKIKDFFIDRKISRQDRDRIPLIIDRHNKNKIIWIAGHQMSDDYKVTDKTKELLKLEIQFLEN